MEHERQLAGKGGIMTSRLNYLWFCRLLMIDSMLLYEFSFTGKGRNSLNFQSRKLKKDGRFARYKYPRTI